MERWCKYYYCWCEEAEDITDGMGGCDYVCECCEDSEIIEKME